eukprot:scaffold10038_cov267-Chaetoceros_neogracile.AAC.1
MQSSPMINPRVYTCPLESNLLEWHYVIEGPSDTPYQHGFYWGKLIFPKQYPLKPPSVMMITPNGRFKINRRICLSMSDYHPESWNPMWSVSTVIQGLISFMVETAPTLGSIDTTPAQKSKFARHSLENNVKDELFRKLFPELVERHEYIMKERIKLLGEQTVRRENEEYSIMNRSEKNEEEQMRGILALGAGFFVAILSVLFAMRIL